jgi:tryptophan synthase alpha chain
MSDNPYRKALALKGKPLFLPFTVLGDPDKQTSLAIVRTLLLNGADALELGLPFSDPPADGPVIQAADNRALRSGIRIDDCFEILREIRRETIIPIGLLTYFNLVLQRGIEKFYRDCADAGVNSVLIADLPLEHVGEILDAAESSGVAPVFIVSALTTDERLKAIAEVAKGYIYIVSYVGITGVEHAVFETGIRAVIERTRRFTKLPLLVGFGINTPEQAKSVVRAGADGVIVASRLVKEIPRLERVGSACAGFAGVLR